jgi:membrane protein implicated in regulation of membrane protease activity
VLLTAAIVGLFLLPGPWNVLLLAVAMAAEVGEIYLWKRYLDRRRVRTGAEGLVGEAAEVMDSCEPEGRVRLRGEIWRARCTTGDAPRGARVRITGVDGLTLEVEREREPTAERR